MIRLYCGLPGHGKSATMLDEALRWADKHRKWIVTNMWLDLQALHDYALSRKLYWVASCVRRGLIFFDNDLKRMMAYENAVAIMDEMAIYCNSREWNTLYKDNKKFFMDMALHRHWGLDFFCAAQDPEMIDVNLRRLTNHYVHMRKIGIGSMVGRIRTMFTPEGWDAYLAQKGQGNPTRARIKNSVTTWWVPRRFDPEIFLVYNTHERPPETTVYSLLTMAEEAGLDTSTRRVSETSLVLVESLVEKKK